MSTPRVTSEAAWRLSRAQPDKGATPRDVRVALVAAQQNGIVATRQLRACGVDRHAIRVRVANGRLHPVFRGVYAVGHPALTQTARFTAAVLACGAGAVLSHHAAAAVLGLLAWDDGRHPEVIVPRGAGRKIDGIAAHRARLDPRDVWTRESIRVTSPARTILDLAATRPHRPLRRTVRQAQAEQHVNVRQLLDVVHRHPRHRGAARLRTVIADGPAPTRSDHEDIVLDLITHAGLQRPEINPRLRLDDRDIEPDLLWRAHRLAIECDSRRWHSDPLTQQDDADKQAILEAHGIRVLRITWHQGVDRPRQTLRRIRAALRDPLGACVSPTSSSARRAAEKLGWIGRGRLRRSWGACGARASVNGGDEGCGADASCCAAMANTPPIERVWCHSRTCPRVVPRILPGYRARGATRAPDPP